MASGNNSTNESNVAIQVIGLETNVQSSGADFEAGLVIQNGAPFSWGTTSMTSSGTVRQCQTVLFGPVAPWAN